MSILNCCGCINNNEREIRGKAMKKRYQPKRAPKKGAAPEDKQLLEDGRNSNFFRPDDDSKFRSM